MKKRWTAKEENELRDLYGTMTSKDLAVRFGTTEKAIYQKCFKLKLNKDQPNKINLSDRQIHWLKKNYPSVANEICAAILGISLRSVVRIARSLGLFKTDDFMKECQIHAAQRAKASHLKNGTYPAKGYYSPNLQKGKAYQFKPGHKTIKPPF